MNPIGWVAFGLILLGHFCANEMVVALMAQPNGFTGTPAIVLGWMPSMILCFGGIALFARPLRGSVIPTACTLLLALVAFITNAGIVVQAYGHGHAVRGPVWAFLLFYMAVIVLGCARLRTRPAGSPEVDRGA